MNNGELITFKNASEYRRMVAELEQTRGLERIPVGVNFLETGQALSHCKKVYIDLTSTLSFLESNETNLLAVENMLELANDNVVFVAREDKSNYALEKLPLYFSSTKRMFPTNDISSLSEPMRRRQLLVYKSRAVYDALVKRSEESDNFRFVTFAWIRDNVGVFSHELLNSSKEIFVDLTSLAATNIPSVLYTLESVDELLFGSLCYIVDEKGSNVIYESFPSIFDSIGDVTNVYPDLVVEKTHSADEQQSYCMLSSMERAEFITSFQQRLTGHTRFKDELGKALESFAISNMLHDQRVLSIFLFGESGVGKTETARLLNDLLAPGSHLAKINFESYISQDSLNSLIGSPAGYIGCECGELNDKIAKCRAKVLLCDEFDKTNRDVQNFFLELLEDGFYTDRMGVEHDLNGYIIVFTSNLRSEKEFNDRLPHELRTRFDLICEFVDPSDDEKTAYAIRLAKETARQYEERLRLEIGSIDVSLSEDFLASISGCSLREINKMTKSRIADFAVKVLKLQDDGM